MLLILWNRVFDMTLANFLTHIDFDSGVSQQDRQKILDEVAIIYTNSAQGQAMCESWLNMIGNLSPLKITFAVGSSWRYDHTQSVPTIFFNNFEENDLFIDKNGTAQKFGFRHILAHELSHATSMTSATNWTPQRNDNSEEAVGEYLVEPSTDYGDSAYN